MPLTVLDRRTATQALITVSGKRRSELRARSWVLRELDRMADQQTQLVKRRPT